jgi:ADP-heptose:LPS heptosyltransferase
LFPWKLVVEKFGKRTAFVGLARESLDFVSQHGSVFLRPTRDLLELASVIAGSRLFAGNQSVGYALAEAMKVDSLHLRQVADGNVPLAWIAGILDSAPHPAEDLQ